jgi:AraC-like DNA-binding protein
LTELPLPLVISTESASLCSGETLYFSQDARLKPHHLCTFSPIDGIKTQTIYTESPHFRLNRPENAMAIIEQPPDPLSDVLSLLKPVSYAAGGFAVPDPFAVCWQGHPGIKCYAVISGQCWLRVETVPEPVLLQDGDCFLLPRGLPFSLSTDLSLTPVDFFTFMDCHKSYGTPEPPADGGRYVVGGFFGLTGGPADELRNSLPPIVHIRKESDKATMRWSLERMRQELRDPQPGGTLIAQQLAYMMLIQALRLHLAEGAKNGTGWFFALADPGMRSAIAAMHAQPGDPWTLQSLAERVGMSRSVFAQRFKQTVGATPMEYLTRWRMLLAAERLKNSSDSVSSIALSLAYDSESAFSKAFRRVMGCSPRNTRNQTEALPSPATQNHAAVPLY